MRPSIAGALLSLSAFAPAACAPPVISMNVNIVAPLQAAARQSVPPSAPSTSASSGPSIIIKGSALERLGDDDLARRALATSRSLRRLAAIGRRDERAARDGVHLMYAKTAGEVRTYILGQYRSVRIEVMDEQRELTRRLGERVVGSDAVFEAPGDPDAIEGAADALEALARRLVIEPG